MRNKRALLVIGSGASLEFGAPSTKELTKLVRDKLASNTSMRRWGADKAFQRISDTLASYLQGGQEAVTFEHIYHCAQELLSMTFEPTPKAVDEFRPILYPFVGRWVALNEKEALSALVRYLPEILFAELSIASDHPKIELTALSQFIESIREEHITRIYTTNYDDFILQAVPDLFHGFVPKFGKDPKRFDGPAFWNSVDQDSVFHLHGSVHFGFTSPDESSRGDLIELCWFEDRADARTHCAYTSSPMRQMDGSQFIPSALITGFDKLARMQQTAQSHYFASLAYDAMRADILYVIGFSLADLHIDARLVEARRRRPAPPLIFVDHWDEPFLEATRWDLQRKEIEMLHMLLMLVVDFSYRDKATNPIPGWTLAEDGSCAVWDQGFSAFLNDLESHRQIVSWLS